MPAQRPVEIAAACAGVPRDDLAAQLLATLATRPRCAVTRYLLGCLCFDRGCPATGVRHFMIAHHAEPRLQSAALLVFAGLAWVDRRGARLLPVLLDTWEEFRRPAFDCQPLERRILDLFDEPGPELERLGPLARRLWRLPIDVLRGQLREAAAAHGPTRYPQLMAPA